MNEIHAATQTKKPNILAIETSCDETAISFLSGLETKSHHVHTQAAMHAEYGGVFPNLAKREHTKNLVPVLSLVFKDIFDNEIWSAASNIHPDADVQKNNSNENSSNNVSAETQKIVTELLAREGNLGADLLAYIGLIPHQTFLKIKSNLDAIAVTYGPGLEPALWVGISFAKSLAVIFDKPLMPINHMEGHIASVLAIANELKTTEDNKSETKTETQIEFPAIALLISGGHTELVLVNSWHHYQIIGQTVDDAVGEAYDKVARVLGLPYPGGPEISKLAEAWRSQKPTENSEESGKVEKIFNLPRPMIHSKDLNFSFSGLKTAVLYAVRDRLRDKLKEKPTEDNSSDNTQLNDTEKIALAGEFEEAVIEVLISKTKKAILENGARTLLIGGGVIANTEIRKAFGELTDELAISLFLPEKNLSTDNATMIGIVAALQYIGGKKGFDPMTPDFNNVKAEGNLVL